MRIAKAQELRGKSNGRKPLWLGSVKTSYSASYSRQCLFYDALAEKYANPPSVREKMKPLQLLDASPSASCRLGPKPAAGSTRTAASYSQAYAELERGI